MRFIQHPEQIIQTSVLADLTGKRIFLQIGVRNVVAELYQRETIRKASDNGVFSKTNSRSIQAV